MAEDHARKRISLNFQNINIRAVLQILADFSGVNIVVSEKVQGTITLRLNHIPWDKALDIILSTHGLEQRKKGKVLIVDTKEALIKMGEEQLEPTRSELVQVTYAKASDLASLLKDKQNSLLSPNGKLSVDNRTNTLWIQDSKVNINKIRVLIRRLDVPVKQVLIEARIVEVTKDFARDLGIRWSAAKVNTPIKQVEHDAGQNSLLHYMDKLNLDLVAAPLTGTTPAAMGLALAKLGNNILLDLELSALESEGLAELISSPRLLTTNQQPAEIDSGQEIPYQQSTRSGATAIAFKKAVLSLKVIPQITPDNKILMELKINQDVVLAQTYNGVPAIATKEIMTNALVNNGQTIVLGGIYQQSKNKTITRVPFWGKVPVMGNLFKSTQIGLKKDELLIFITPRIIANSV